MKGDTGYSVTKRKNEEKNHCYAVDGDCCLLNGVYKLRR